MTTTETVAVPEGFTAWAGSEPTRATMFGKCPADAKGRHVSIYFRRGSICHDVMMADILNWTHSGSGDDIIAYRIESALASAEPVAWELTCHGTVQQIVRREDVAAERLAYWRTFDPDASCRELVYTHAQPAAKVEAPGRDAGPSFDDVCRAIRAYGLACIDLGMEGMRPSSPTPASVPDGYVMAPHFRGFAHLGLGQYRLFHSRAGSDAELYIVPATPDETAGRVVGDLRDDGPDEIPAELMAVRLRFENVAGLDALEQQLRLLRETHFSAPPTNQEGTAPIDASDNADYIDHCAAKLKRLGYRITAEVLSAIAVEHRQLAVESSGKCKTEIVGEVVFDPRPEGIHPDAWIEHAVKWVDYSALPVGAKIYLGPVLAHAGPGDADTEYSRIYAEVIKVCADQPMAHEIARRLAGGDHA